MNSGQPFVGGLPNAVSMPAPNLGGIPITHTSKQPDPNMVDHPPHYTAGGIEAIDVIEAFALNFHLGNAIKYVLRAPRKGSYEEDLRKAIWYLERELEYVGKAETP